MSVSSFFQLRNSFRKIVSNLICFSTVHFEIQELAKISTSRVYDFCRRWNVSSALSTPSIWCITFRLSKKFTKNAICNHLFLVCRRKIKIAKKFAITLCLICRPGGRSKQFIYYLWVFYLTQIINPWRNEYEVLLNLYLSWKGIHILFSESTFQFSFACPAHNRN